MHLYFKPQSVPEVLVQKSCTKISGNLLSTLYIKMLVQIWPKILPEPGRQSEWSLISCYLFEPDNVSHAFRSGAFCLPFVSPCALYVCNLTFPPWFPGSESCLITQQDSFQFLYLQSKVFLWINNPFHPLLFF